MIENGLVGVISLPAGVFNPYSGVKTSILIVDKKLHKQSDSIFFAEVKNDGFTLGAQRTPIKENDIPSLINDIRNNERLFNIRKSDILLTDDISLSKSKYIKTVINTNFKIVKLSEVLLDKPTYGSGAKKSDFDAKGKFYLERYVSAHAIMISFEGIPAIYFNSMFGTSNDEAKFIITGNNRDVNRYRWNLKNISNKLKVNNTKQSIFYNKLCRLLNIRRKQKAFHPNAQRINLDFGPKIYGFKRISKDKKQTIICITNLSSKPQNTKINIKGKKIRNLLNSNIYIKNKKFLKLKPFETIWLSSR